MIALERMLGSEASCQPFSTACDTTSAQQQQQGTAAAVWAEAAGLPRTLTALPRKDRRQVWMRQQEERAKLAQQPVERAEQPPEQVPPDDAGECRVMRCAQAVEGGGLWRRWHMHAGPEQGGKEEELSMGGNMQPYILQHAARACEEPSREEVRGLRAEASGAGESARPPDEAHQRQQRPAPPEPHGRHLHQRECFCVVAALLWVQSRKPRKRSLHAPQTIGAMAHVDASVAGTPGLDGLLEDLSRMALAQAPALGTWAVPNIMWSLGILHANPLGEGGRASRRLQDSPLQHEARFFALDIARRGRAGARAAGAHHGAVPRGHAPDAHGRRAHILGLRRPEGEGW